MNNCEFIGNLTKDVVIRTTQTGKVVCSFSIACNRSYTDKNGQKQEIADFVNITAWEYLAKKAGNSLKKGSKAYIKGRLTTRSYEQDGVKKYTTEILADTIEPIMSVKADIPSPQFTNANQGFNQGYGNQNFNGGGNFAQFGEEQIPF